MQKRPLWLTALLLAAGVLLTAGPAPAGWRDLFHAAGQTKSAASAQEKAPTQSGTAESDSAFQLISLSERELDGSPALALTFSNPLDPKQSYDRFIRVMQPQIQEGSDIEEASGEARLSPGEIREVSGEMPAGAAVNGKWVLGENPRILFFPHVTPEADYRVQVDGELADKAGHRLGKVHSFRARTAAVSPAYYFASRGMVLPARQNGGLPVVTVNVPEVDVQFLRVRDDHLPEFLDKVIAAPRGQESEGKSELHGAVDNWDLDQLHNMTESVYAARFVTESKANRRAVTFLPVEDLKELAAPGVYVAVMSQPGRFRYEYQTTYFYVSDLGLHARLFTDNADVYVSSLTDGKAVPRVALRWLDQSGKVLAKGTTDSEGRAHFDQRPQGAAVIQAQLGAQVAMIALKEPALDLSEYSIKGEPGKPVRFFAWSGRDLYRPGEHFDLSVLARDADGRALPPLPLQAVLKRPDGKKQFSSMWKSADLSGYYQERIELPLDAPTGFWQLELRADPADEVPATVFRFGVEEFLPERMKLSLAAPESGLRADGKLTLATTGTYLYGAPAAGNRLLGVVQFQRCMNPLSQSLPGFVFGDANEDSFHERRELTEAKLDERGKAKLDVELAPASGQHSPISVRTTVSLLESGGRPVVRSLERVLWPAETLVGVRPLFSGDYAPEGAMVSFEVVRVNEAGQLLAASELPVRLFHEDRHYYWRYEDGRGWSDGFTETEELVHSAPLALRADQRGKVTVPVNYGRYRLEISDQASGQTMKYRFYAGWSAKTAEDQGMRPDKVKLDFDKPAYREGQDKAQLTITPPHGGEALVTVEGSRTLWVKRLPMPKGGTTLSIPIDAAWKSHDLYVNVLVFRPGSEGDSITPARALGLAPLPLERGERRLKVAVAAPDKMKPEQDLEVQVEVPAAAGRKALLTLSAVDVGILNITNFATPNPFRYFFGQLRYGADLHDIYGHLIEKMAGRKGRLRFGGDAAPKTSKGLPKKVRLVDLFSGPVELDAQGKATVKLPVPDFNGTLRLMAVAATEDSYGSADREVVVAAPMIAELSAPRFMNWGDEARVALDLHNLSGGPASLKVRMPPVTGILVQNPEQDVQLADQEKKILTFNLTADRQFLGLADLRVQVSGRTGVGPLSLDRSFALEVKPLTPVQQKGQFAEIQPGALVTIKEDLADFLPATVLAHVNISDKPPLDVKSAVQGLLVYPYGCVEQTTSTTYPHLFIDENMAQRLGLKPFTLKERAKIVGQSMGKLEAAQGTEGGFSLWGGGQGEYWLSAYVGNFLQDAGERGFEVPAGMRRKTMDFLLKYLQEGIGGVSGKAYEPQERRVWSDTYAGAGRFNVLAYGAYVLARDARAPLSTLRRLHELRASATSGLSLVHLGLALHLMGDEKKGRIAIDEGLQKARIQGWWGDYGSDLTDVALSYALLKKHRIPATGRDNLLIRLANILKQQRWFSTQEQMAVFLAGSGVLEADEQENRRPWRATVQGGANPRQLEESDNVTLQVAPRDVLAGLNVTNNSERPLYAELVVSGRARVRPEAREQGISLSRRVFTADGTPFIGDRMQSGESYYVHIHVLSSSPIANVLVEDHIPAGLEIENLNLVRGEGMEQLELDGKNVTASMASSQIVHQEFREDRYVAALNLTDYRYRDSTYTYPQDLFYRVRAVTPGLYTWPSLSAADMYRPAVNGFAPGGGLIRVVEGRAK